MCIIIQVSIEIICLIGENSRLPIVANLYASNTIFVLYIVFFS